MDRQLVAQRAQSYQSNRTSELPTRAHQVAFVPPGRAPQPPLGKHSGVVVNGSPRSLNHGSMVGHEAPSTEVHQQENQGSTEVHSTDLTTFDAGMSISLALARAGLTHKQACAYMELDPSLWHRQLSGDGHVSMQRLLKLPMAFWRQFLPLLAEPADMALSHHDLADIALMQAAVAFDALVRGVTQMRLTLRRVA